MGDFYDHVVFAHPENTMRKLLVPILGILATMATAAFAVWNLGSEPHTKHAVDATHQPRFGSDFVAPANPRGSEPPRFVSQTEFQPIQHDIADSTSVQNHPVFDTANRAVLSDHQPVRNVERVASPEFHAIQHDIAGGWPNPVQPAPSALETAAPQPASTRPTTPQQQIYGQPGLDYAAFEAMSKDPSRFTQAFTQPSPAQRTAPAQRLPATKASAQSPLQPVRKPPSNVRLMANYDNAISPDEDLLQGLQGGGAGTQTPPATSFQPPAPASSTTRRLPVPNEAVAAPVSPTAPASPMAPTAKPINKLPSPVANPSIPSANPASPVEDMLGTLPNVNNGTEAPSKLPSPAESSLPNGTQPLTNGGGWNKNTPPSPEEDLLQDVVNDLPPPKKLPDNIPDTAPPTDESTNGSSASEQNAKPPFVTGPAETTPPKPPNRPKLNGAPHGSLSSPDSEPGIDPHLEIYAENCFPSAKACKSCHEQIYDEWAGSSHAYASISPMFHKFEQTIHALSMGTISHFCMRCHAPVATALSHPREKSIWESVPAAREGVTCIACHRVNEDYGKVNGERRVEMGDIHQPMYGAGYGEALAKMIEEKSKHKIKTTPGEKGPGQNIHTKVIHFDQIADSSFCVSCHQVAVVPGIALEVVWAQYRASPACKQGITCQECHMGREPGVAAGYNTGPVAVVNGKEISPFRKHSNHMFYGPGYSIAHPGLFPHNEKSEEWSMEEWLQFDYRAGWGTEKFEELLDDGHIKAKFPAAWDNADDRADAREVVDANLEKLHAKRDMRHRLMENGSHIEGPIFKCEPQAGRALQFRYDVTNQNPGHNMPSGSLGAQPQLWLNVVLTGPNGRRLWESGYVDRNGDIADVHSLEVAAGRIPRDTQLFNLQTKFLITGVKGTDREMYLPVNTDFDQLPFLRPSGFPITVMNHPPFIRMEAHSVPPLGTFPAKYKVPANLVQQPGRYRLSIRMRSRAEPIYFMRLCKATPEMERNMNYWMLDFHEESFDFIVR